MPLLAGHLSSGTRYFFTRKAVAMKQKALHIIVGCFKTPVCPRQCSLMTCGARSLPPSPFLKRYGDQVVERTFHKSRILMRLESYMYHCQKSHRVPLVSKEALSRRSGLHEHAATPLPQHHHIKMKLSPTQVMHYSSAMIGMRQPRTSAYSIARNK